MPPNIHPAALDQNQLLKQCTMDAGQGSGPGGQHRNRRSTAITYTHEPTGIQGSASERREQKANRSMALRRLRLKLAIKIRSPHPRQKPSVLWNTRRAGTKMPVNPKHPDYPALLAEAMDVIKEEHFDVAAAAGRLAITMSQLTRLVRHESAAFAWVNEWRKDRGFPLLRS
jgi:hypothetical protein